MPKIDGVWQDNDSESHWINEKVSGLISWANYTTKHMRDTGNSYDVEWDWHGPSFWAPGHCIGRFDYNRGNKFSSPYLGIIGTQTNITDEIGAYYMGLSN